VQDLRCKLAMQQIRWEQARAERAALMQLTPGLGRKDLTLDFAGQRPLRASRTWEFDVEST
jgi:hypothetical protein